MRKAWILLGAITLAAGCTAPNDQPRPTPPVERHPIPAPPPVPVGMQVNPSLRAAARQELDGALHSPDSLVRMHAVESARDALGSGARDALLKALNDVEPAVRFAAAVACGELRLAEAKPRLRELLSETDPHVQMAAIFAMHRLGDTHYSVGLEAALKSTRPDVRANAAFLLGRLGERSAVTILFPLLHDPALEVRLQAAEALWRLGSDEGLNYLAAAAMSGNPATQMVGVTALAGTHDNRVIQHVRAGLDSDYDEVKLVTARALGWLGSDEAFILAENGAKSSEARQRQLAALALGAIGRPDAQQSLSALLKDPEPDVRLAAAEAILELK